jgi:hypothetical protein
MTTTVNSLRIEASVAGAETAIAKLRALEEAQRKVGKAGDQLAKDTDRGDKSFANAAKTAEALRRKYIDGYSAAQNFRAEVARLNRAIEAGTISSSDAATVLSALKSRMDQAAAGAVSAGTQMQTFGRSAANATHLTMQNMGNLQFQLNDIAMGLATGQSPFIVISQQGAQIAQMFGPGTSIRSAIAALGAGFVAMLNPINLTVVGLAAAAAGVSYLWSTWDSGGSQVEEALKRHEELISQIKDAYGEAAKGAKDYASESLSVIQAATQQMQEDLRAAVLAGAQDAASAFPGRSFTSYSMDDFEGSIDVLNRFRQAMHDLDAGIASGEPNLRLFREQMAAILQDDRASESQRAAARYFIEITEEAGKAARALEAYATVAKTIYATRAPHEVGPEYRGPVLIGPEVQPQRPPNLLDFDPDKTGDTPKKETKAVDTYAELMRVTDQRIAQLRVELTALGMTEEAARRYRLEQELLLQAQQRGIALSPQEEQQLRNKAQVMAEIQKQTEDLKDAQKSAEEAGKFMASTLEQALMGVVQGGDQAKQAIMRLIAELLKGALIGEGAFAGVFKRLAGGGGSSAGAVAQTVDEAVNGLAAGTEVGAARLAGGADAQSMAWNFWASKGLKPHQIAGVMGNIGAESGFNPSAVGDGGKAWGLYQHHADRRAGISGFLGDPMKQHELAWQELQGPENRAWSALMGSSNVREATAAFGGFERPQGFSWGNPEGMHNWTGRLAGAEQALAKFGQTTIGATEGLGTLGKGFVDIGGALAGASGGGGGGGFGGIISAFLSLITGGGFAKGGVTDRPAVFGEAGPEAAVPLPDGRSIPVKMHGGRGGSNYKFGDTNITIQGEASGSTVDRIDKKIRRAQADLIKELQRSRSNEWRDD